VVKKCKLQVLKDIEALIIKGGMLEVSGQKNNTNNLKLKEGAKIISISLGNKAKQDVT
jgi:hypothetical protein